MQMNYNQYIMSNESNQRRLQHHLGPSWFGPVPVLHPVLIRRVMTQALETRPADPCLRPPDF